jgi:hypothetical protein
MVFRMTALTLLISLAPLQGAVDAPTLEFYQEHFVVRQGAQAWRVPAHPPEPRPILAVAFRRNENYAVWDERGLTIRRGVQTKSTYLPDIPTSPRAFPREEILRTAELISQGKRSRNAAALSGAMRIGNDAFFLLRWESVEGKPWAEALVKVDLSAETLQPKFLGRFAGLSVAYRPIDDRLFRVNGLPAIVTRNGDNWGVGTFDLKTEKFGYRPFGGKLASLMPLGQDRALFVETSTYGTTVGGEINLESGQRRERFEVRGNARFADAEQPWVMVTSRSTGAKIRNGETGAEAPIPLGAGVRRVGKYIVVFSPYTRPTRATLFDPERWTRLAEWQQPPE